MDLNRRHLLTAAAAGTAALAAPLSAFGLDAAHFGVASGRARRPEPRLAARHRPGGTDPRSADARARRLPRRRSHATGRRAACRHTRRHPGDPDAWTVAAVGGGRRE